MKFTGEESSWKLELTRNVNAMCSCNWMTIFTWNKSSTRSVRRVWIEMNQIACIEVDTNETEDITESITVYVCQLRRSDGCYWCSKIVEYNYDVLIITHFITGK